jgi:hypothetical protein
MRKTAIRFGLGVSLALTLGISALAVAPVSIDQNANVAWSTVINNPFDGAIVYDKNFGDGFAFVSSWSKQGIYMTHTRYWSEVVGYRTVWRTRTIEEHGRRRYVRYPEQEPIRRSYSRDRTPEKLMFAINGQLYTYEQGEVPEDLAAALAGAPSGNMLIRLVWQDGSTSDTEIGANTVEAWKTVFQ